MNRLLLVTTASACWLAACASDPINTTPGAAVAAAPAAEVLAARLITAAGLLAHIKVLASDEFEGRLPGTAGEDKTIAYLTGQFKAMGLAPGNPDGSYVQKVPLVGIKGTATMQFKAGKKMIAMRQRDDFVAATPRFVTSVSVIDSPLVFVGYGVQAPEYGWDDYKGLDVRGKTIVMLINDPPVPSKADAGQLDPQMFAGKGMTYYGRWTYKYEIASKLGAAAAIIVHETEPAAYPWEVVKNSWSGEQFELDAADKNAGQVAVKSWITLEKARALFAASGQNYDQLKQRAASREFVPVPLKAKVSFEVRNQLRQVASRNVVAVLPGSDPAVAKEPVIYNAHWDHLGRDTSLKGDQIYNGAVDNASGVAAVLEIARAFKALPVAPRRPILFMSVTAEEQGLLGSRWYARNPLYPLARTVGIINMDSLNPWGPTRDLQIVGSGQNSLEDVLSQVAADAGRVTRNDKHPEQGSYYRSDQFELAKVGVPGLYACRGSEMIGADPALGEKLGAQYTETRYHKPADEILPDWNLDGAALDMQLMFEVGRRVANAEALPQWKASSEFRAIREAAHP